MDGKGGLCISRKLGESTILLDAAGYELARIKVVGLDSRGRVRLLFVAPTTTRIWREELLEDRPTEG
jgi:sRNA-binding carbon storage regulator CsrA